MAYKNKWKVIKNDQWRYVIRGAEVFSTQWHFKDIMNESMVDRLLGITPNVKDNLRVQYIDSLLCPECGASGFLSEEYRFCPTCGKQMIFDDEEDSDNG